MVHRVSQPGQNELLSMTPEKKITAVNVSQNLQAIASSTLIMTNVMSLKDI